MRIIINVIDDSSQRGHIIKIRKIIFGLLALLVFAPIASALPCYDLLGQDAQSLRSAEDTYAVDWGVYTCDAGAMGWSPSQSSIDDWTCEFATDSTYRWTYANADSQANVTETGSDISAEACPVVQLSEGCLKFQSDWHSLVTAQNAYYTDYNSYGCDMTGYWSPQNTSPLQWNCDSADGFGFQYTFTSAVGEVYVLDDSSSVDCSPHHFVSYEGFGGSSTDISSIVDTNSVSGLVLEVVGRGIISWPGPVNISGLNLTELVTISDNFAEVSTDTYDNLNLPATITLYDLPWVERPVLYRNGLICAGQCTFITYAGNDYTFSVSGFSNYTSGANSALGIWDDNDPEGGSLGKGIGDNISFFANYTNITSGLPITSGSCNISFSEAPAGPSSMTYNSSSGLWEYTRNFSSNSVNWNVTCKGAGYEGFNLSDVIYLSSSQMVDLFGANVTNVSYRQRWSSAASSLDIEGGNLTQTSINARTLTDRWAAFLGNISGNLILSDDDLTRLYSWNWNPDSGGTICLSTSSALGSQNASGATGADIDAAWSFPISAADSGTNTFSSICQIAIGSQNITGARCADTGPAGGFSTATLRTSAPLSKNSMFFCSGMINGGVAYDGSQVDYELIVPTAYGAGMIETYYFYVNLG